MRKAGERGMTRDLRAEERYLGKIKASFWGFKDGEHTSGASNRRNNAGCVVWLLV